MWFIPILVIGAIVVAASRSPRESAPVPPLALVGPPLPSPVGPISTLAEYARVGNIPPPMVIICAIAEAEATGRDDIASDIVRLFVAPVVHQHERMAARHVPEMSYAPPMPSMVPVPSPIYAAMPPMMPPPVVHGPPPRTAYGRGSCAAPRSRSPRDATSTVPAAVVALPRSTPQALGPGRSSTDAEIREMLSADPARFFAMMTRGPVIEVPREVVQRTAPAAIPIPIERPIPPPPMIDAIAPPLEDPAVTPGLSSEVVAQIQEAAGLHEVADQTRALAPGSPIASVADEAWRAFVMQLEREDPTFSSTRHVGQYRQCRDRLEELGIDPRKVLDSAQAQRSALDVDLADAHHHAVEGGLLAEHVGRRVMVPGRDEPEAITLSGVLGVIQCAGLDNATNWLERPGDRKRYPHTTQAFLRTNGVF